MTDNQTTDPVARTKADPNRSYREDALVEMIERMSDQPTSRTTPDEALEAIAIHAACNEFNCEAPAILCDWPTCGCTDDGKVSHNPMVAVARAVLRAIGRSL